LLERLETAQADYFKARQENANKDIISQRYYFTALKADWLIVVCYVLIRR